MHDHDEAYHTEKVFTHHMTNCLCVPYALQIVIHSYFKNMEKPSGDEIMLYSRMDEVQWSPLLPSPSDPLSASLGRSDSTHLLQDKGDITLKLLRSYLK